MTLQQLEYILAVARHGHFGRAADACNVTQPTLSAMIGKLEEEIGAKEGELIRAYRPPLNYQIPTAANWRKFTTNPAAHTITLTDLLERGNSV